MSASPDTAIESQIEEKFEGWSGETIFKLVNGSIWQQSSYAYYYHYIFRPKVVICYYLQKRSRLQNEGAWC